MIKRIHVNQHHIRANSKGADLPVISIKSSAGNQYGNEVEILGADGEVVARVIYRPDKPLSCGAKVWIETTGEVSIR